MTKENIPTLGMKLQTVSRRFQFPDFEVSWAGECPWNDVFCFGSEDGRLGFAKLDGPDVFNPFRVIDSGEAINGVAFSNDLMAVSTRAEVVLRQATASIGDEVRRRVVFDGGAHGVVATASGGFLAPLGINGLLSIEPNLDEKFPQGIIRTPGKDCNLYKIAHLGANETGDFFACAARRDGILRMKLFQGGRPGPVGFLDFPDSDIVDVCTLNLPIWPFAVAGLALDRSVHLIRNVLEDRNNAFTLHIEDLQGTPYTILSAQGHIFMLTSESIYVWPDLASRFLDDKPIAGHSKRFQLSLNAVDASLACEKWLLIVLPDRVECVAIDRFAASSDQVAPVAIDQSAPQGCFDSVWSSYEDNISIVA